MSSAVSEVFNSIGDLDDVLSELSSFSSSLGGSISNMAGGINIDLQANEAVRAAGDDIYAGLDSISSQVSLFVKCLCCCLFFALLFDKNI